MSIRKVGQASLVIALGTASVNLLQVLKLMIVGAWFGASVGRLDEYSVTINLLATVQGVLLGSLQVAFIPVYVAYRAAGEHHRADRAMQAIGTASTVFAFSVSILLATVAAPLLRLAAIGFDEPNHAANVAFFRAGLIYLVISVLCDQLATFYNANKRYALPALAPIVSMAISIAYLLAFRRQGVQALIYGLIWGNLVQLAILAGGAPKYGGFRPSFTTKLLHPDAVPVYVMMAPMAVSLSLSHFNILIDQGVASTLGTGSVSILYYATRLHDVLIKLFACSVAAALLPYLSQYAAEKRLADMRTTLAICVRLGLLLLAPAFIVIWFYGAPAVAIVLQRQAFTGTDVAAVARVWATYSLGLFFTATVFFQQRCFMANRDMKPLWIAPAFGIPLNLAFDLWFSRIWGVQGIALGTTSLYLVYLLFYAYQLRRLWQASPAVPQVSPLWRSATAVLALFAVSWLLSPLAERLVQTPMEGDGSAHNRILGAAELAVIVLCLSGVYVIFLKYLHVTEARAIPRLFSRNSGHHLGI